MAKSESKAARQAYKAAIVQCLQAIQTLNPEGDVGVTFWRDELDRVLSRQAAKLALVELPEVKRGKAAADDACAVALAKVTAERDALAARLASLGRGERAKVREARGEASEAWGRLATVTIAAVDDCNPDPEPPPCAGCDGCAHAWGCDARYGTALEDGGASCDWFEPASEVRYAD